MTYDIKSTQDFIAERRAKERHDKRVRAIAVGIMALFIVIAVALWQSAAGWQTASETNGSEKEVAATNGSVQAKEPIETHVVKDWLDRSVEIPVNPTSIAIMDSFAGEAAIMVGAGDRICGVPGGVKSDLLLQMIYPALPDTMSTSGSVINIESLVDAGCDVALVKAGMADEELAKLDKLRIPYVCINARDFETQLTMLELVGSVCGMDCAERAQSLSDFYWQAATDAAERLPFANTTSDDPSKLRVYHSINSTLLTDSPESVGASFVRFAGCNDVSADNGDLEGSSTSSGGSAQGDMAVTLEQVFLWDPDLIICNSYAATNEFLTEAKWATLKAVRSGNVKTLPVGATRWGQRGSVETAMAIVWLANAAYPAQFADFDMKSFVVDYYHDYLGLEITDELYKKIMSGEGIRTTGNGSGGGNGN